MGMTIYIRYITETNYYTKIYRCSKCGKFIHESHKTNIVNFQRDILYEKWHNLSKIPETCSNCNEKFIRFNNVYPVIIDKIINMSFYSNPDY